MQGNKIHTVHDVILDPELHSEKEIRERMDFYARIMRGKDGFRVPLHTSVCEMILDHPYVTNAVIHEFLEENINFRKRAYKLAVFSEDDVLKFLADRPEMHLRQSKALDLMQDFPEWKSVFSKAVYTPYQAFRDEEGILSNPNIPQKVLYALAHSSQQSVRVGIASNLNLDKDTVNILAHDDSVQVREALLTNPLAPIKLIDVDLKRAVGQYNLTYVAKSPNLTPEHINIILGHYHINFEVYVALVNHPNFTVKNYEKLLQLAAASASDAEQLIRVIANHSFSAKYSSEIRALIALIPNGKTSFISLIPDATPEELLDVIKSSNGFDTQHVLRHKNVDENCLREFFAMWKDRMQDSYYNEEIDGVAKLLFSHPETPQDILRYLINSDLYSVGVATAARTDDVQVMLQVIPYLDRYRLIELISNPNTPKALFPIIEYYGKTNQEITNNFKATLQIREEYDI